jgi:hypothetical protein
VIAFRLAEHARTAHGTELLDAARRCGVQNTPPGGAGVALAARVDGVTADSVHVALEQDRTLLQAFSFRADPHVFPTADRPTFTQRLLPDDEEALRGLLTGAVQALDRIGISASDVVDLAADAAPAVLDGKALTKDDLGREIGDVLTDRLPTSADRRVWRSPSWYASGQFLGESVVRFVLPVLALRGELCHGARSGRSVLLCRTDQWLRTPPAEQGDARRSRAPLPALLRPVDLGAVRPVGGNHSVPGDPELGPVAGRAGAGRVRAGGSGGSTATIRPPSRRLSGRRACACSRRTIRTCRPPIGTRSSRIRCGASGSGGRREPLAPYWPTGRSRRRGVRARKAIGLT